MAAAIGVRHTDRGEYFAERLAAEPLDHLRTYAAEEGATLTITTDPHRRHAVAAVVEQADRMQASRLTTLRELVAWLRLPGRHRDDGLPVAMAVEPPGRRARRERHLVEDGPALAVISTPTDEDHDWLATGQALSAVLLAATARGLSASFFDAPIEEASLRRKVGEAAGAPGVPQVLLRLGHGLGDAAASPRRSVDDVLR